MASHYLFQLVNLIALLNFFCEMCLKKERKLHLNKGKRWLKEGPIGKEMTKDGSELSAMNKCQVSQGQ